MCGLHVLLGTLHEDIPDSAARGRSTLYLRGQHSSGAQANPRDDPSAAHLRVTATVREAYPESVSVSVADGQRGECAGVPSNYHRAAQAVPACVQSGDSVLPDLCKDDILGSTQALAQDIRATTDDPCIGSEGSEPGAVTGRDLYNNTDPGRQEDSRWNSGNGKNEDD